MKNNMKIRQALFDNNMCHWELASILGIAAETLSRKLRYELSDEIQKEYLEKIEEYAKKNNKECD